ATATDPNGDALSFNWSQIAGPAPASFSATDRTDTRITVSVRGAYTFRFRASDGQTSSFSDTTVTFAPDPTALAFEAEGGDISSPFVVTNGAIVQNVETTLANSGRAAYGFTLVKAGNYLVTAILSAPNTGSDSLFVNIDAEPIDPTMVWD